MSARSYFRWSFALPLVLPIVLFLVGLMSQALAGTNEATLATRLSVLLGASLVIGGIPYVLFLIGVLIWSKNQSGAQLRRFTLIAPAAFSALFVVLWIPYAILSARDWEYTMDAAFTSAGYYALLCLGFGYFYVLVVHLAYHVMLRLNKIDGVAGAEAASYLE